MVSRQRRWLFVIISLVFIAASLWNSSSWRDNLVQSGPYRGSIRPPLSSKWAHYKQYHPITSYRELPKGKASAIPKIQFQFPPEIPQEKETREARLNEVRSSLVHSWKGYRDKAWAKDEVAPLSGESRTTFGGWAATLVDSLDTLWIAGMNVQFDEAVAAVARIDFTTPQQETLNVFETTIRYLGGLLAAYDLSGREVLLTKAAELGEMLYASFDTESRIPVSRWNWTSSLVGEHQQPNGAVIVAELGSLSLEFTRLSQLTGDPKYFDAISRLTDLFHQQQSRTRLGGLWPIMFSGTQGSSLLGNDFSLGAMADSLYEYLPKEYMLLGGRQLEYRQMYEAAVRTAKQALFYRPMLPDNKDVLISGIAMVTDNGLILKPEGQHLVCFVGGMVAIGAKVFNLDDMDVARKLVDGCTWAYEAMPSGIMPETFTTVPCGRPCQWDETKWKAEAIRLAQDDTDITEENINKGKLPQGFVAVPDKKYLLRPEAIESVFILYRITGDPVLQEKGWKMFQAIQKHTRTEIAHAALADVTEERPPQFDKMESFWVAETLKYFYLLFSEPSVISLDDYVLNTEAHPLKRPK